MTIGNTNALLASELAIKNLTERFDHEIAVLKSLVSLHLARNGQSYDDIIARFKAAKNIVSDDNAIFEYVDLNIFDNSLLINTKERAYNLFLNKWSAKEYQNILVDSMFSF